MTKTEYNDKLNDIVKRLEQSLGRGAVMRPDSDPVPVEVIPTRILNIDKAIGVGGIPRGRITEIYGPESSGKTSLCLSVVASCQQMGGTAAYIDVEHALDMEYAQKIGVDINNLLLSQPDTGEQALEVVEALVRTGEIECIVIDSVAALVPKAEIEGEMGQSFVGLQARLMSQALRKLTGVISKSNCAVIFLNQLREKVGVMYGSPEITPGGRALKFYCSLRMELRRGETITKDGSITGNRVKVKVVKNKVASPYKETLASVYYNEGFSKGESILDAALEAGIFKKSGAWIYYGDQKWQGRDNLRAELLTNSELAHELEQLMV